VQQSRALGVTSHGYETDLSVKENILKFTHWVNSNFNINILINNAGRGGTKCFGDCDTNYIDGIIQLNVATISIMTHQLLPNLQKQEQSYILNVASMASFSPIGYKTVYPASKAFVLSFSRGLYQELKRTSVFVSVVHPGPMMTNSDTTKRIEQQGRMAKMGIISPEKMAKRSLEQLFKRDTVILIGWMNKLNWLLIKLIPIWIRLPLLTNIVKREVKPKQKYQAIPDKNLKTMFSNEEPTSAA